MAKKLGYVIESIKPEEGKDDNRWRVQLIQSGTSQNGNDYALSVLHRGANLFEGVRALARSDEEHLQNRGKRVKDLVGWFENPKPNEKGVEATFIAESEWLNKKLHNAHKQGKDDYVGFSIVAYVKHALARSGGRLVRRIKDLQKVDFVDVIVNPSAGGGVLGLAEANDDGGELMNLKKLLAVVEAKRPELYKKLTKDPDNIDEAKVIEAVEAILEEQETKITEAAKAAEGGEGGEGGENKNAKPKEDEHVAEGLSKSDVKELIKEAVSEVKEAAAEELAMNNAMHLADKLLAESALPDDTHDRVRDKLKGMNRVPKDDDIKAAITAEAAYLRKHTSWVGPNSTMGSEDGAAIESIVDERDKWDAAMQGLFADEDQVVEAGGKKFTQARYQSIRQAYRDFTGDEYVTGELRNATRLSEAAIASGSWAGALGDNLNKAMQREYKHTPYTQWRQIADVVPLRDFRSNYRPQLGGFSNLASVAEGGAYAAITTEPDDFTPSYAVTKYGNTQVVNLETIVNDDVGAVRRIPRKLARAAARTLNTNVWSPVLNNSNVSWEAVALAAAGHGNNITTSALSPTTIIAGRTTMMKQVEPQSSERLNIPPRYLAVPVDLEQEAYEYTQSPGKPLVAQTGEIGAAGSNDRSLSTENQAILNFIKSWNLIPLVIPHWTETAKWWLLADKMDVPMLEVGFLGGREEPELFTQDMPNVGSMFTNDQLTYKVRQIYGVVVLDFRGFYFGNV